MVPLILFLQRLPMVNPRWGGMGGGCWPPECGLMVPPTDSTCSLDSLSENKIGDEGVEQLSATFPRLKALETLK